MIEQLNWLEVFIYDKWTETVLPKMYMGMQFKPSKLEMTPGETTAPKPLTESDLITLMDKNGIGTDATIHEHIKHVQEREYVTKTGSHFIPTKLGCTLVEVYAKINVELYKPSLRAAMEADMKCIGDGLKTREEVYNECITEMEKIFARIQERAYHFKQYFAEQFGTICPPIETTKPYSEPNEDSQKLSQIEIQS